MATSAPTKFFDLSGLESLQSSATNDFRDVDLILVEREQTNPCAWCGCGGLLGGCCVLCFRSIFGQRRPYGLNGPYGFQQRRTNNNRLVKIVLGVLFILVSIVVAIVLLVWLFATRGV